MRFSGRLCVGTRLALDLQTNEFATDRQLLSNLAAERDDAAAERRWDFDRRLVGHHRRDDLILAYDVADLHRPLDDLGLGDTFADIGELYAA